MRLTKTCPNGTVTLDGSQFHVNQEVIDSNIRNSKPIKAAVERLKKLEDRNEPRKPKRKGNFTLCPQCDFYVVMPLIPTSEHHCSHCGQALDWSEAE